MSDSKRPTADDLPLTVLALVAQVINPGESEKDCGLEKHGRHLRQAMQLQESASHFDVDAMEILRLLGEPS